MAYCHRHLCRWKAHRVCRSGFGNRTYVGCSRTEHIRSMDHSRHRRRNRSFFSPGGESLGFADHTRGVLKIVSIRGGLPTSLAAAPSFAGGVWLPDGTISFAPKTNLPVEDAGLWSVSANGTYKTCGIIRPESTFAIADRQTPLAKSIWRIHIQCEYAANGTHIERKSTWDRTGTQ